MTSAMTRRFRHTAADDGIALVTVLGVMLVVTALLLTMLAVVLRDATPAREDQDSQAAMAAAQAGVDDYLARLQADSNYATRETDSSNPAMTADGRAVPGGLTGATYRYEVLKTSLVSGDGSAVVKVTGEMNGKERSLTTTFRPKGFLDFIYFTDQENQAPRFSGSTNSLCTKRWWEGRSASPCGEIGFAANDVITGPLHTNDTPALNGRGVTFDGSATTSTEYGSPRTPCVGRQCYRGGSSTNTWQSSYAYDGSTFAKNRLTYDKVLGMPAANTELKARAQDPTLAGCYFTGATHIGFTDTTMKVFSPNTRIDTCGFKAASRGTVQTVDVPDGNVIYVDTATGSTSDRQTDTAALRAVTGDNASSYPRRIQYYGTTYTEYTGGRYRPDYGHAVGNAYVQGTVDGKVTIASARDIIVTDDLLIKQDPRTYQASDDIIGLVPNSTVWVYHPVYSRSGYRNMLNDPVSRIDAAILTVQDSFFVQHYDKGANLGDLTVLGAISQRHRGTVGTSGGNGYIKDYIYDPRYATGAIAPPFFLAPTSGAWTASRMAEG